MASPCTCYNGCSSCGATCGQQCSTGCGGTCGNGCGTSCSATCSGTCQGKCQNTCGGGCEGSCKTGCSGGCKSGCKSGCKGTDEGEISEPTIIGSIGKYSDSINEQQIGAYLYGLNTSNPSGVISWYLDGAWYADMVIASNAAQSNVQEFTNLQPGTAYVVSATINYANGSEGSLGSRTISTTGVPSTGLFKWTYAGYNDSGKLIQGTEKMPGYGYYIHADEWNDLIANVKSKLQARGMYSESNYPMTIVSSGYEFKAEYFNDVRFAIGSLANFDDVPELKKDKLPGDEITAKHMNSLMDHINRVS